MEQVSKLLLHIPHSSTIFPANSRHGFKDLNIDEKLLIDYYTDELFIPKLKSDKISSIIFPYCRLYCDVERLIDDPLERDGLGIRYTRRCPSHDMANRYFTSKEEAFGQYVDYHAKVSKKLFAMDNGTLLIDCHSFSNHPTLLCATPPDIDICIGFNDDETRPNNVVIGNIVQHFKSLGYKVGINEPFSNSKTFAVPSQYHSIMIEVNKRLYMDEQTLEKTPGFTQVQHDIQSVYELLI